MTPADAWKQAADAMFNFPIGKNGKAVDGGGPATPGPKLPTGKKGG